MLINDDEAKKRLNSPFNLINKLRKPSNGNSKAMSLFGIGKSNPSFSNPYEKSIATLTKTDTISERPKVEDSIDDIVKDSDEKIKMELIRSTAVDTLVASMQQLKTQIPSLESPTKLADVASKMSRIVTDIDNKKNERKGDNETIHYHFYMPEQRKIEQYDVIEVS